MWKYWLFDMLSTLLECVWTYAIADTICISRRKGSPKWLPYIILFSVTYLCTWVVDIGIWKMPVIMCVLGIALWVGYRCSVYNAFVCAILRLTVLIASESIGFLVCWAIYKDSYVVVDGRGFGTLPIYVTVNALSFVFVLLIRKVLVHFQYQFTVRDFCIVLIVFVPMFCISVVDTTIFLNGDYRFSWEQEMLIGVMSIALIVLVLYLKNYLFLREKEEQDRMRIEQLQRQYDYYQDKLRDEERVRSIYHDMKNHLLLLQAQTGNGQEVRDSVQALREHIRVYENYYHTGNEFLDVIIRDKAGQAREKQIDFASSISFEDGAFINLLDISTIFGNALDNAIEASEKLPAGQRLMTVKASRVRDLLVIVVENNVLPDMAVPGRTTKQDTFLHGLGLSNIRRAVEGYGGQCSVKAEDEMFSLKIVIPIP